MTVPEKRSVLQALRDILDKAIKSIRALLHGGDATIGAAEGRRLAERADQLENSRELVQEFLQELETARRNAQAMAETQATTSTEQQQNAAASEMQAAASEDVRFSIKEGKNGRRFVEIDTDQHIFDGLEEIDTAGRIKALTRYMRAKFRGQVLPVGNSTAYVGTKGINECTHPAIHNMEKSIYGAKIKAGTELNNLLEVAQHIGHVADDGHHTEATGGWDYYQTLFKVGDDFYEGRISIENTKRGREFHDITQIKRTAGDDSLSVSTETPAAWAGGPSTHTIPEPGEDVKHSRAVRGDAEERYPQAQQSGREQVSYATLTALPDMPVTQLETDNIGGMTAGEIMTQGMKGLTAVPGQNAVVV